MKYTIISCSIASGTILSHTKEPRLDVKWAFKGSKSKVLTYIRIMWFKYNFPMKKMWLSKSLNDLGDIAIIFDSCVNEYILAWLKKAYSDKRLIFYYWNSINNSSFPVEKVRALGYEIWGFDPADAIKYKYRFNPQFFCKSWYECLDQPVIPRTDISFVGRDKNGRMQAVEKVLSELNKTGKLTSSIYITAPKWYLYFFNRNYKRMLNFDDMIRKEMNGRVLLDIENSEKCGYTLRIYDALCNRRKLITNNINILHEDFYDKHNIFVYGVDLIEDFETFINTDFSREKEDKLENNSISNWLMRFL